MIEPQDTSIDVSLEFLFHYQCRSCEYWWTIADRMPMEMFCPRCGQHGLASTLDTHVNNVGENLLEYAQFLEAIAKSLREGTEIIRLEP